MGPKCRKTIKLIEIQKLTAGHARVLVGLSNASFVAAKIIEKKLSVRQAESFVKISVLFLCSFIRLSTIELKLFFTSDISLIVFSLCI